MACFGISNVEPSGSAISWIVKGENFECVVCIVFEHYNCVCSTLISRTMRYTQKKSVFGKKNIKCTLEI
jgi:hypothetical protein